VNRRGIGAPRLRQGLEGGECSRCGRCGLELFAPRLVLHQTQNSKEFHEPLPIEPPGSPARNA